MAIYEKQYPAISSKQHSQLFFGGNAFYNRRGKEKIWFKVTKTVAAIAASIINPFLGAAVYAAFSPVATAPGMKGTEKAHLRKRYAKKYAMETGIALAAAAVSSGVSSAVSGKAAEKAAQEGTTHAAEELAKQATEASIGEGVSQAGEALAEISAEQATGKSIQLAGESATTSSFGATDPSITNIFQQPIPEGGYFADAPIQYTTTTAGEAVTGLSAVEAAGPEAITQELIETDPRLQKMQSRDTWRQRFEKTPKELLGLEESTFQTTEELVGESVSKEISKMYQEAVSPGEATKVNWFRRTFGRDPKTKEDTNLIQRLFKGKQKEPTTQFGKHVKPALKQAQSIMSQTKNITAAIGDYEGTTPKSISPVKGTGVGGKDAPEFTRGLSVNEPYGLRGGTRETEVRNYLQQQYGLDDSSIDNLFKQHNYDYEKILRDYKGPGEIPTSEMTNSMWAKEGAIIKDTAGKSEKEIGDMVDKWLLNEEGTMTAKKGGKLKAQEGIQTESLDASSAGQVAGEVAPLVKKLTDKELDAHFTSRVNMDFWKTSSDLLGETHGETTVLGTMFSELLNPQSGKPLGEKQDFMDMSGVHSNIDAFQNVIADVESSGGQNLTNKDSSAKGIYHFLVDDGEGGKGSSFQTGVNRVKNTYKSQNIAVPSWVTDAHEHNDPLKLTDEQQSTVFMANLFQQKGSNRDLYDAFVKGDINAMENLYWKYHFKGPKDDASAKNVTNKLTQENIQKHKNIFLEKASDRFHKNYIGTTD